MTFENTLNKSLKLNSYIKFKLKNQPIFNSLLETFQSQINYIHSRLLDLIYIFDIDQLNGKQLDFLGVIIGQERITSTYTNNNFVFDSSTNGFDNGVFDAGGELIDDDSYRFLLKAKIIRNNTKYWAREDIIKYHKALLGEETVFSITEEVLSITLTFENSLDDFKRQALNTFGMKIAGVNTTYEVPLS